MCSAYKPILGKCNALLKKKYVDAFTQSMEMLKLNIYGCRIRQDEISHEKDLIEVFGKDIMRTIDK